MRIFPLLTLALGSAIAISPVAHAQDASGGEVLTGKAALGDWRADKPGVKRLIKTGDLDPPFVTPSASNSADKVKMPEGAKPRVPPGFTAELVASGLANPRAIRAAPNGDLFVADSRSGTVRIYRVPDGQAKATEDKVFASGLNRPYGIAFYPPGADPEWVYVANTDGVVRFPYQNGDLKARGKPEEIVKGIPSTHHWTRDIAFSPDGQQMFFSVGSGSNVALDMSKEPMGGLEAFAAANPLGATWDTEEGRADVLVFDPQGKNKKVFATGLRNCSGMTVQPETGALWCVVNERDELGDNVPFEYATTVKEGAFYGWPWFYIGNNQDPRKEGERQDIADKVTVPDVLMQAHTAPLGIAFYEGDGFPKDYKGDAFVTMHGSWNRGKRAGYKVVRLHFEDGKPTGVVEDFMTGFVVSDDTVWGRPVGIAVGKDGSLFVTEDGSGTIWRVSYTSSPS